MKAPDKIYMPNELLSEGWQRHIEGEDTEYIRRDFLMKESVVCDAVVTKLADRVWITPCDEKQFHKDVYDNFKAGDRVRIIVIKSD